MAMDVGGAKGGVKSDINVTPLVDVMLVLLIIMMLVAPLLQQGVQLTLPTAVHTTDKPDTSDQTVVFVDANSRLYVNTIEVPEDQVVAKLQAVFEDKGGEKVVYLKGDVDAPYGAIMKMMDALRKAQIDTVGLITEKPGGTLGEKGGE
jgi:biopolymer transport protein TolR